MRRAIDKSSGPTFLGSFFSFSDWYNHQILACVCLSVSRSSLQRSHKIFCPLQYDTFFFCCSTLVLRTIPSIAPLPFVLPSCVVVEVDRVQGLGSLHHTVLLHAKAHLNDCTTAFSPMSKCPTYVEKFFLSGGPSSSAAVRVVVVYYLKEGEEQKEVLEAKDDEEKECEIDGEVGERATQRAHETWR